MIAFVSYRLSIVCEPSVGIEPPEGYLPRQMGRLSAPARSERSRCGLLS